MRLNIKEILGTFTLGALLLFTSAELQAAGFNYSYFEFGYRSVNGDTEEDVDGDILSVGGSFEVAGNINALVKYEAGDFDFGIDTKLFGIGLGYHTSVAKTTDVTVSVQFVDAEVESSIGSDDDTGFQAQAGVRFAKNPRFELHGDVIHTDLFEETDTAVNVGIRVRVANDKSFDVHYENGEDESGFGIGIRMDL